VQGKPDGRHDCQRGERGDSRRERDHEQERERGHEATAAHRQAPLDPNPDRREGEQGEGAAAAQRERRGGVELLAGVPDDRPHREREQRDADDHRKVRVRVHFAGTGSSGLTRLEVSLTEAMPLAG
jgi:hypothetical protein